MVRATVSSPKAAPAPRVREMKIILDEVNAWNEDGAPFLVRRPFVVIHWISDLDFDAGSDADFDFQSDATIVLSDEERSNGTIDLDSTIDLTDEEVESISHSAATDHEKSDKSKNAMEKSDRKGNHTDVTGESANNGNAVALSEREADGNYVADLLDDDLDSVRTSNTPWPIDEGWAAISNSPWPIQEDANSNTVWSDEIKSNNSPWMSAEDEGSDVDVLNVDFPLQREVMWLKIQSRMQHDSTLIGLYTEDFMSRKRKDPNFTFDQWLDIKVQEEVEARDVEEAGSGYNMDHISDTGGAAATASDSSAFCE
ncbi:unnamed protein product [Cylicocyclus nassatus]|uniref:Uncharacterized protein n=1 Tax=Cylicocyclus nassatus TaxID=53992 RepID=A0AA36MEZ7_CYLNA|nr:unnamed protein product [Cylicocyclus nassatus]